jgi:hypothetical protein
MEERERPSKASPTVITTAGVTMVHAAGLDMASRALTGPPPHGRREGEGHGTVTEPFDGGALTLG